MHAGGDVRRLPATARSAACSSNPRRTERATPAARRTDGPLHVQLPPGARIRTFESSCCASSCTRRRARCARPPGPRRRRRRLCPALSRRDRAARSEAKRACSSRRPALRPKPPGIKVRASTRRPSPGTIATALVRFHAAPGGAVARERDRLGEVRAPRCATIWSCGRPRCIQSPDGPYVCWSRPTSGTRSPSGRSRSAASSTSYAAVSSGLEEDERIVALHTFALDAERRLGKEGPR